MIANRLRIAFSGDVGWRSCESVVLPMVRRQATHVKRETWMSGASIGTSVWAHPFNEFLAFFRTSKFAESNTARLDDKR
nr:hypothetical protein CFP56_00855 [Quercus suber]